ncbi:hypothetical protein EJ02DRAFT_456829 [Clathrospora elynae]|uniref:Aminoglycoside phosphotransferase domain-containing protein n=1 Tax=Clathrospora elynae TaxID=706981 RepID=A0A6A5SIT7_9PLEO|nr:hypothetical protein EJ02DRAFT_456829 [Clathrospora elynae]
MSEDTTIKYIQHHTSIPAPNILKCTSERDDELGFEFMIMDRVPGTNLRHEWESMSWLKKEVVVRKVVAYLAQLFQKRFTRIGNLYATNNLQKLREASYIPDAVLLGANVSTPETAFCLSQIVSIPFFWGNRINFDVPRGPFKHSREWLAAELQLHIIQADEPEDDTEDSDSDSEDEPDELATPEAVKGRAQRLLKLLPTIFSDEHERFVLHHGDLNSDNILVDSDHNITGILDWECIHTVPLWYACETPKFLASDYERNELPDADIYLEEFDEETGKDIPNEALDCHMEEYEKTQLRNFFFEEMQRVCPEWVQVHRNSKLQTACSEVVSIFGEMIHANWVEGWIARVEKNGHCPSISSMLRGECCWD